MTHRYTMDLLPPPIYQSLQPVLLLLWPKRIFDQNIKRKFQNRVLKSLFDNFYARYISVQPDELSAPGALGSFLVVD